MKKFFLFSFLLIFALSGCGQNSMASTTATTANQAHEYYKEPCNYLSIADSNKILGYDLMESKGDERVCSYRDKNDASKYVSFWMIKFQNQKQAKNELERTKKVYDIFNDPQNYALADGAFYLLDIEKKEWDASPPYSKVTLRVLFKNNIIEIMANNARFNDESILEKSKQIAEKIMEKL